MTEEEKEQLRNWRLRWLGMLFEFSHLEYQKGLWIEQRYTNEASYFGEDMCQYFDDLSIDNNYQMQLAKKYITEEEYEIIEAFHNALDKYEPTGKDDSEILEDPVWISIVESGSQAWHKLKSIISDTEEMNHMKGLEKNYLNKE